MMNIFRLNPLLRQLNLKQLNYFSVPQVDEKTQKEQEIANLIKKELLANYVQVIDTSVKGSACGTMYKIIVESPQFTDKTKAQQHQLVTGALKDILKGVHGFNLKTIVPKIVTTTTQEEKK